jgi:hypothetical protein
MSLDLLMGSYDRSRVTEEEPRLLTTVAEMRQGLTLLRGNIFQGALSPGDVGVFGLLVDSELWELSVAAGEALDLRPLFPESERDPETAPARSDWCRRIVDVETKAVDQSFHNLDAAIDWSRIRAV